MDASMARCVCEWYRGLRTLKMYTDKNKYPDEYHFHHVDFMSLDPGSYTWAWAWIQDLTQYDAHPADMHQTLEHWNIAIL